MAQARRILEFVKSIKRSSRSREVIAVQMFMVAYFILIFLAGYFVKPWVAEVLGTEAGLILMLVLIVAPVIDIVVRLYVRAVRHERRICWLTGAAQWSINQLHAHGLEAEPQPNPQEVDKASTAWPWGGHHTAMLGHLDAAARKWWANYDPASPDTAPTNDMVSEWLRIERDVSKDKAKAIASILRADNLRTGPRH